MIMATPAEKPKVLVAVEHFVCEQNGRDFFVHAGDRLTADHPVVAGREDLFRERTEAD
jgi:hypothetical protein